MTYVRAQFMVLHRCVYMQRFISRVSSQFAGFALGGGSPRPFPPFIDWCSWGCRQLSSRYM